jgi:hypothetical protein
MEDLLLRERLKTMWCVGRETREVAVRSGEKTSKRDEVLPIN